MARSITLLPLALFTSLGLNAQTFRVIAKNYADSVVLRWAPSSATAWEQYNKFGYRVERTTIDRNTNPSSRSVRVGPDTLRPWPLERFQSSFPEDHPYAGPVVQLLYGEPIVKKAGTLNMASVQDAATELTMRYSFTLLMADMDGTIAQALGLRFADHDVKPDANYLYRVITLDPDHPDTAMIGVNRSLGVEVIPPGPLLYFDEEEHQVRLKWDREAGNAQFSAYWVERAEGSGPWMRLHDTPFLPTTDKDSPSPLIYFSDSSMARDYVPYRYRVLGVTPFGELSTEAPIITAMGRDRTPPVPVNLTEVKDEKGKLVVHWVQPVQEGDLKGYRVEKSLTARGGHHPLHSGLLPKSTFSFTDTSTYLIGENHYRVAAVDTAGNVSYSNAGYGFLIDSVAPAAPIHISGTIDTAGIATLHWPLGKEPDILGYRVFFANASDHAFNNLTPYPIADTVFHDTLQIKTLTKRIYYRVVAVDRNYNHSAFSGTLVLTRPDIIPPVAPVFKDYLVTDSAVTIHFIPSSSDDVARHDLQRKERAGPWNTVLTMAANDQRRSWIDTTVNGPAYYSYRMVAVDSVGNISQDGLVLDVRVYERLKRDAVRQVTAVRMDDHLVHVSWNDVPGKVEYYVIYRAKDAGEPMALGSTHADTTAYDDIRLKGKGSYTYLVQAVYADGTEAPLGPSSSSVKMQ